MERYLKGAMTREEVAAIYGISTKTLKKWFLHKGLRIPSGIISPSDQRDIFLKLGLPKESKEFHVEAKQDKVF
jgi:uncharacterized protein YjcR